MQLNPAPEGTYAEFRRDHELVLAEDPYTSVLIQTKKIVPVKEMSDDEVLVQLRLYLGIYIRTCVPRDYVKICQLPVQDDECCR